MNPLDIIARLKAEHRAQRAQAEAQRQSERDNLAARHRRALSQAVELFLDFHSAAWLINYFVADETTLGASPTYTIFRIPLHGDITVRWTPQANGEYALCDRGRPFQAGDEMHATLSAALVAAEEAADMPPP